MDRLREYFNSLSSYRLYFVLFLVVLLIVPVTLYLGMLLINRSSVMSKKTINTSKTTDYSRAQEGNTVVTVSLHTDDGYLYKSSGSGLDAVKNLFSANPSLNNQGSLFPKEFVKQLVLINELKDADDEFLKSKNVSLSNEHYVFNQTLQQLPIFAAEVTIHLKNQNEIYDITGSWVKGDRVEKEKLTEEDAKEIAHKQANKDFGGRTKLTIIDAKKNIVNLRLIGTSSDDKNYPALRVTIQNDGIPKMFNKEYFVSLTNGDILYTQDKVLHALNRNIYDCKQNPNCPDVLVRAEGSQASNVRDADTAYTLLGDIYNFYKTNFQRDSYDNNGALLKAYVNYPGGIQIPCPNAFWDGIEMVFCPGLVVKDVTTHELTHAVVEKTVSLAYAYQSFSLNESIADIFASGFDGNWTIGEGSSLGVIRNMQDPTSVISAFGKGQPDRLFSSNYYCGDADSGGSHINNGVINKSYYLMVQGGEFNGCSIQGIGKDKALNIIYRVLSARYLNSNANFYDMYSGILKGCADLYGADSSDCTNVKRALQSTEIDQQPQGTQLGASCQNVSRKTPACTGNSPQPTSSSGGGNPSPKITLVVDNTPTPINNSGGGGGIEGLSIKTDKKNYKLYEKIQICYTVPQSNYVQIIDVLPSGEKIVIAEGIDDGQGGCFVGVIYPPTGKECLQITYGYSNKKTAETCFNVEGSSKPVNMLDTGQIGIVPSADPFADNKDKKVYYECKDVVRTTTKEGRQIQISELQCLPIKE